MCLRRCGNGAGSIRGHNIGGILSGATTLINEGKKAFTSLIESKNSAVETELVELNDMLR